ncbi:MAG: nuclear transport factor 2 family protein [Gammaproteobacteria bacterium]|nr:nuclear transport factor 2 family protein [Gammaproteobacteria bacterium]
MKNQKHLLLAATLTCVLTAPTWAAESAKSDPVIEEVRVVLRQHDDALNKQDMKALMALYADNPDVVMMGTGPGEFWRGKTAVEETYKQFFQDFKAGTLQHQCPETAGGHEAILPGWSLPATCKTALPMGSLVNMSSMSLRC